MNIFSVPSHIDGNFLRMSRSAVVTAFVGVALLAPPHANADIFKCKDANGKYSYQQIPCEKNTQQQQLRQGPKRLIPLANNEQKPKPRAEQ